MGPFKSDRKIKMIKLFNVKIRAYGYIADFNIRAEDIKEDQNTKQYWTTL